MNQKAPKINKNGEIEEKIKQNFHNKNDNPLDSIKKIRYVKDLVEKTLNQIDKFEQKVKEKDSKNEEDKSNDNESKENNSDKRRNHFAKKFIKSSKKFEELKKINELLIMLRETNNLNMGINKLNNIIDELNEKGHKLPKFEKNNMEMFFSISDVDKAEYKKNKNGPPMSLTVNYSLLEY